MVIIIEGVDKSGKSTFAERIAKSFPGILIKITDKPKGNSLEERIKIQNHYRRILKVIEANPETIITLDRFYPSELCYSIKRGYEAKESRFFSEIEDWFLSQDHLLVFCNPGKETIEKRMESEPDEYVTKDENIEILERYEEFFKNTKLNKIKVDTLQPIESLVEIIRKKLDEYKRYRKNVQQLSLF